MSAAPATMPPRTPRIAAALRRIGLLLSRRRLLFRDRLRRGGGLARAGGLPFRRRGLDAPQRGLEVVEDEPDRRIGTRRRRDGRLALAHDEDAALAGCDLELGE